MLSAEEEKEYAAQPPASALSAAMPAGLYSTITLGVIPPRKWVVFQLSTHSLLITQHSALFITQHSSPAKRRATANITHYSALITQHSSLLSLFFQLF